MECIIKQTNKTMAVVAGTPGGLVTGEQLAKIAELVKQGAGLAKFTTAQRIVILTTAEQVPAVRDGLAEVGLKIGPGGKTIRNVKGCAGSLCKYALQDGLKDALALDKIFAGRDMPGALKIAVCGCTKNCMECQSNDIGIMGTLDGYRVFIGGRGGRKQVLGQVLKEGVNPEELPALVEEIIAKYLAATKGRERISHVVQRLGIEAFK